LSGYYLNPRQSETSHTQSILNSPPTRYQRRKLWKEDNSCIRARALPWSQPACLRARGPVNGELHGVPEQRLDCM